MTTQTQMTNANRAVSAPIKKKTQFWLLVLAAFLLLPLISAAILVLQPKGEEFVSNRRALESISVRYQGMADLYAAGIEAQTQRALEIISSRYQGMVDLSASGNNADAYRALDILSSRYQGMADIYAAGINAQTQRALEILSSRYQGMADLSASGN